MSLAAQPAGGGPPARIEELWRRIYGGEAPEKPRGLEPAPPAPAPEQPTAATNFLDHLIFRLGSTYTRNFVSFTGRPTRSFVIDDGPPGTVTPEGFSFPQVFEASDDRLYSYLVLGTRGYGDPRLNTYVSLIHQDDLDGTRAGSPFQSILDAFGGGRRTQVLNGYAEMNGLGTGALSQSSLRLGRQFVFDTTPQLLGSPVIDGATLGYRDSRLEAAVFSGRRVNFFGGREADFSMGGSASYQFQPGTSGTVNYFFLPGFHRYALDATQQIGDLRAGAFLTFRNVHPIDLGVRGWYAAPASPWTIRGSAVRRLTDEDFSFDIFREREAAKRLFLLRIRPATHLTLDADHQLRSWLTLGGGVAARFVDGTEEAFDNSFEQVTLRAVWTPLERWDALFQYRFRHVERSPVSAVVRALRFDDINRAGETDYHELNGELHYRLGSHFSARVGGYFGLFDSRNRLAEVTGVTTAGGYLRGRLRVHRTADLRIEYGIDRGNPEFNPDIAHQHTVRVGFDVHY
ncbi:MAG: hypothetical protein HY726_21845 [Candidatus Rokubacteria bacterium]|nr:hypothetical protein [Candidatus Rokubacteria bacterium]